MANDGVFIAVIAGGFVVNTIFKLYVRGKARIKLKDGLDDCIEKQGFSVGSKYYFDHGSKQSLIAIGGSGDGRIYVGSHDVDPKLLNGADITSFQAGVVTESEDKVKLFTTFSGIAGYKKVDKDFYAIDLRFRGGLPLFRVYFRNEGALLNWGEKLNDLISKSTNKKNLLHLTGSQDNPASPPLADVRNIVIFVARGDQILGQFNTIELTEMVKNKTIFNTDLAWVEGEPEWMVLEKLAIKHNLLI